MATLPNFDYDTEQLQLAQRQKVVDAMLQGGLAPMGPTETAAGGVAIRKSPFEALSKLAQTWIAQQGQGQIDKQRGELGTRYRSDLRSGMNDFMAGLSAQPGQIPEVADESGGHGGPMMSGQDAKQAKLNSVLNAIASNHPVLQQLGMSQLASLTKQGLTVKDLMAHATPRSQEQMARTGDTAYFVADPKLANMPIGEVTRNSVGEVVPLGAAAPNPSPATGGLAGGAPAPGSLPPVAAPAPSMAAPAGYTVIGTQNGIQYLKDGNGDLFQQTGAGIRKIDQAPKTTVNTKTIVNAGENAFAKGVGEMNAKELGDLRKAGDQARKMQPVLTKLETLAQSPTFSGPTANGAVWAGELAQSLGIPVDKTKIANSEEYQGVLAKQISNYLTAGAGVGRSLTDADRQKLEEQFPNLIRTPEGRAKIITTLRESNQRDIQQADAAEARLAKEFPELRRILPGGLTADKAPQTPNTIAPSGKPTVSNWPGAR